MMAISMAETGLLNPTRGDLVLFANTTAEHPGTYTFAARVCEELENRHGLPCLWYEFCTVETATHGHYTRTGSYQLVKRTESRSDDTPTVPGYRTDGEAFEEMASWRRLPDRLRRVCTTHLKVSPGHLLLSEWLAPSPGPAHSGHHHNDKMVTAAKVAARYRGTQYTPETKQQRVGFVTSRPQARPEQQWQHFTKVDLTALGRPAEGPRPQVDIWGKHSNPPERYVALLGLRADEPQRVERVMLRSMSAEGASSAKCRDRHQPPGEFIYTPLHDSGITDSHVRTFWDSREYDLNIPEDAGNCVFCFMKGAAILARLAENADTGTPAGISWWASLEERYSPPSDKHKGNRLGMIHHFGKKGQRGGYAGIAEAAKKRTPIPDSRNMPCHCTD